MNIHWKAIWAGLIVCAAVGVGCHKESDEGYLHGPKGRTIVIHVRSDAQTPPGKCFVDLKTVDVYKPDHQKLRWKSDDGQKYTADFEMGPNYPNPGPGTPFKDEHGKDKHTVTTDEPEIEATGPSGYYFYAVLDKNGNKCLNPEDPGVHVTP